MNIIFNLFMSFLDIKFWTGPMLGATAQGLIWGIMVLGVYITYKVLDVADLTVDGSFATGGCIFAVLVVSGFDPTISLLIAAIVGGVAGFVTGILHTKFKIPAILAGILTQLGLYSINLRILGNAANMSIGKIDTNIKFVSTFFSITQQQAGLVVGLIVSAICIILLYILFGTEIGASIRATGNNSQMIRALGVDTDKTKLMGIVLSNMLIGLSGALLVQMNKYADVGMGKGAIVYGLASIVIGEVIFRKIKNFAVMLTSSVVGCIIFFAIRAIVIKLGMDANDMQLLSSIIVAIALSTPIIKEEIEKKRSYRENTKNITN